MEFFERAHVVKESSKKESKYEKNVKKQLKQMLYGYKTSDNELIKKSANANNNGNDVGKYLEESTSVSGFSDLSLTSFNNEADTTQETMSSTADEEILFVNEEINLSNSDNSEDRSRDNPESISECDEDIQSLSEDAYIIPGSSISDENIIYISSFEGSSIDVDTSSSEAFDADGSLATKIFEKLGKKEKTLKKSKKIKLDEILKTQKSSDKIHKRKQKEPVVDMENDVVIKNMDQSNKEWSQNDIHSVNVSVISNQSSPYISITATDMQIDSLSDVLGDYIYPTIKNIPSDKQNIIYSTSNSAAFLKDSMSVDDTNSDDEIGSLIPELDEDQLVEDLDIDISTQAATEVTTAYDDTMQTDQTVREIESSNESIEVNFVNPVKLYYGKNSCIFVLRHPTEFYIHGKVKVRSLGGTVEVLGYTLNNESCELYAPHCYYAHCLKTVEAVNAYYGLFGKLTSLGLSVAEAEEIVTTIGEYDAVVSLTKLCCRKIDFVENYFTVMDLFSKRGQNMDNFRKASELLGCSLYLSKPRRYFEEKTSWKEAIAYGLSDQSRGIVCGGKGTGKSTFLRYCVNKLLARGPVLVIDLDPGQAEFTLAGNISVSVVTKPLLGPNFTHLRPPEKMLTIGMINTMDNPLRYAAAIQDLLTYCRRNTKHQSMPWIVNTMGMCNNMGLKFISLVILLVQPTYLLQLDVKSVKKRFEFDLDSPTVRKLYFENYVKDKLFDPVRNARKLDFTYIALRPEESSEPRKNSSLAPADERYLNVLAYFGELLNLHSGVELLGIVPYEVNLRDLNIGMNVKIKEDAVMKVINGKIIALCQHTTQDKGEMFTLDDKPLLCLGHGLIRSIDVQKGIFYIITPMDIEKLRLVNILVYADWMPELRGQEKHLPGGVTIPYRTATVYQHRQLMLAPCRRFNPLQLLKMTRSS